MSGPKRTRGGALAVRSLDLRTESRGNVTILRLAGDVDLGVSAQLRRVLLEAVDGRRALLVDMGDVRHFDSSGVANLVEAFQRARGNGGRFALSRVPEAAMRVIRIAQLDGAFPIHSDIESAMDDTRWQ